MAISKVRKSQLVQLSGSLATKDAHYVCGIQGDLPCVYQRFCWSCCLVLQPKYQQVWNREPWLSAGVLSRIRDALQRSIFRETCSHPTLIPGRWEAAVSKINVCKVLNAVGKQFVARLAIYVDGLQGVDRDVFVMPYTRICTSN